MLRVREFSVLVFATVFLSGCADAPEDIQANAVNPAQYAYMTCRQLADYAVALNNIYEQAADQQNEAQTDDAIGYIIFQDPVGSDRYPTIPAEIAELKGRMAAVQSVQRSKACTSRRAASLNSSASGSAGQ